MKSLVRFFTIVLATVCGIVVFWELRIGLWLFLASLAVAAAFRSPIQKLIARGVPEKIAIGLAYLLILASTVSLLALISNPLLVEIQMATNEFTIAYQYLLVVWSHNGPIHQFITQQLPSLDNLQQLTGESGFGTVQVLLGITSNFFEMASAIAIVLLLSIYWTIDHASFGQMWLTLIPVERRANALAIWREMETNIGAYIRSEFAQALLTGLSLYIGYTLLGLDYPMLLALTGTLASFIPVMGGFLIIIPVAIVGLSQSWWIGTCAVVFTLMLFLVIEWLIEPYLFNQRRFSSLLLLLTLLVCVNLFGLIGLILAPLLSVAIQVVFSQVIFQQARVLVVNQHPDLQDVQQRLGHLQTFMAADQSQLSPPVVNLVERLQIMVEKVQKDCAT